MKKINVTELDSKLKNDPSTVVVDVRTRAENRAIKIDGTINIPVENVLEQIKFFKDKNSEVYVFCHSGNRSTIVCEDLALHGVTNLVNVDGGIQAWINKGLPVKRSKKWSMPIMQQVMAIAGSMILMGVIGSLYVNHNFIYLAGFVGLGLTYAGISGNCYMTKVLALFPWNK